MRFNDMFTQTLLLVALFHQAGSEGRLASPPLRLEMRLRKQSYCRRMDRMNVNLEVQLRFTNTGEEPLILYRKCDRALRVSRSATASDVAAGKYEESLEITPDFFYPHIVTGKEAFPPQDSFMILRPGESYFLNSAVGFAYCVVARRDCQALTEGEHYLQVVYATWKEPLQVAKQLSALWRPFGSLWYKPVVSEPMAFVITGQQSLEPCPAPPKHGPII